MQTEQRNESIFIYRSFPRTWEVRSDLKTVCVLFSSAHSFSVTTVALILAPLDSGKLSVSKSLLMNSFTFVSIFGNFMSWGPRKGRYVKGDSSNNGQNYGTCHEVEAVKCFEPIGYKIRWHDAVAQLQSCNITYFKHLNNL